MLTDCPAEIRERARSAYRRFAVNPSHPSLQFKRVHTVEPLYSVRIALGYRALAMKEHDTLIWFWIGRHDEYERLLKAV